MPKIDRIVFLFLIVFSIKISAQADSTNRYNAKGKKTGYWKRFLDERAMPTDSANSYLYGYEFYDNGKLAFNVFISEKNLTRYKIVYDGKLPAKGNPVPIHGTLKWFDLKDGNECLLILDEFENGYPKIFKEYNTTYNDVDQLIDFTKKYNNQPGSYYAEQHYGFISINGSKKLIKYWCYKEKNKWKNLYLKN